MADRNSAVQAEEHNLLPGSESTTPTPAHTPVLPEPQKANVKGRLVSQATHRLSAGIIAAVLPLVGLIAWSVRFIVIGDRFDLVSHAIGGRLTQPQAKFIDFAVSAVLAPLLFVGFNWYWFASLRVTVLTERSTHAVPLMTIIEASNTDRGSYNFFKIIRLLRGGAKTAALGLVVLLSAVAQTSFANMIAYEAYDMSGPGQPVALRPLLSGIQRQPLGRFQYNFTVAEQSTVDSLVLRLLSDMSYHSIKSRLENGTYIGLNATRASLDGLPAQVVGLSQVPAYRVSTQCETSRPTTVSVLQMGANLVQVRFDTLGASANLSGAYDASYPGKTAALTDAYNEIYPFVGFPTFSSRSSVYLADLQSFNLTERDPVPTPYGNLTYNAFNMSQRSSLLDGSIFRGTKEIMSASGIKCRLLRQTGALNLTRRPDLTWTWSAPPASAWAEERRLVDLVLADFQTSPVFHLPLPRSNLPGLGPVLYAGARGADALSPVDYGLWVQNMLYAAAEVERIAYETKQAGNKNTAGDAPVGAIAKAQHYRMTYVPLLLLLGLLSTLAAAAIPLGLMIAAFQTSSFRDWRDVDSLRLLIDSVEGLCLEPQVRDAQTARNAMQEKMASRMTVRYFPMVGERGGIVLRKTPTAHCRQDEPARRSGERTYRTRRVASRGA